MKLFSETIGILENSLSYSSLRQKAISENIANVDTPNYKAKEVSFKNMFNQAVEKQITANRTDNRHFEFKGATPQMFLKSSNSTAYNHNGNNVDIDKEMSEMAENQIYYNALIDRLNGKFNSLSTVIKGGK